MYFGLGFPPTPPPPTYRPPSPPILDDALALRCVISNHMEKSTLHSIVIIPANVATFHCKMSLHSQHILYVTVITCYTFQMACRKMQFVMRTSSPFSGKQWVNIKSHQPTQETLLNIKLLAVEKDASVAKLLFVSSVADPGGKGAMPPRPCKNKS